MLHRISLPTPASAELAAHPSIAAPPAYLPDDQSVAALKQVAALNGGQLQLTTERQAAYEGAEVIYAKSWASTRHYGQIEADLDYRRAFVDWQVTAEWMRRTKNGMFMHCLPVRRNVVVADAVLDSQMSVVIDQAENRLHAQKALLAGPPCCTYSKRHTLRSAVPPGEQCPLLLGRAGRAGALVRQARRAGC